jgi:hypothetical protein
VTAGEAPLATPIKTEAGTIPTTVNPPRVATPVPAPVAVAAAPTRPAPEAKAEAPAKRSLTTRIGSLFKPAEKPAPEPAAQAEPKTAEAPKKEGITAKITRKLGLRSGETTAESSKPAKSEPAAPGAIRPAAVAQSQAAPATPSTTGSLMSGAQPIPSSASFDSRFAFR